MIIFVRHNQFLDNRYRWCNIPDLFPMWHAPVVMRIMMDERNPTKPTGLAIVDPSQVIDLDTIEIIPL